MIIGLDQTFGPPLLAPNFIPGRLYQISKLHRHLEDGKLA